MAVVHLVRHGRATGGWDVDPDPGLDDVGVEQARRLVDRLARPLGARPIVTSPLRRCRETAAPLATRWGGGADVEPLVTEIPSPPGVPMGERVAGCGGDGRDVVGARRRATRPTATTSSAASPRCAVDTVVVSHFVAINAVIGACTGDDRVVIHSLDNTSVTTVETTPAGLVLIEAGHEADTLIRDVIANATLDWHGALAWALIIVNAVAGAWALAAQRWSMLRARRCGP